MTSIEWVKNADGSQGLTWNPIRGCTRVSPGCGGPGPHGGCYAEGIAARFSGPGQPYEGLAVMKGGKPRWTGKLAFIESALLLPLRHKKPTTWFVNSMSDLFHESVPDASIDRVFAVMALCPQHTFQVLTKRSMRMRAYLADLSPASPRVLAIRTATAPFMSMVLDSARPYRFPLANVWLGVSAEDQRRADERVPDLLATPAAVRFVSAEPLLGPIEFAESWLCYGYLSTPDKPLDWIIVGGESGPNARPMHPAWARSIRDQCAAAGVAFHFKQWGAWLPADGWYESHPVSLVIRTWGPAGWTDDPSDAPESAQWVARVGKKAAGRLLDGVEHNGMPEVRI